MVYSVLLYQWKQITVIHALGSALETKSLLSQNSHVGHSILIYGLTQIRYFWLDWFKRRTFLCIELQITIWVDPTEISLTVDSDPELDSSILIYFYYVQWSTVFYCISENK